MRRRTPARRPKDGLKDKERSQLAVRALVLFWGFFIVCALLGARLFLVQVRQGAGLAAYAGQEQFGRFPINARRGDILDRFGDVFATSLPSASVFVYPNKLTSPAHETRQLASLLSLPVAEVTAMLHSASDRAYLARNVPASIAARIEARNMDGVGIEDEPAGRRVDPQAGVGSTIVG
ncbi:MAG: hypothetical protein M3Z37_08305, partial [Candidatus Eremiobacteraeota bacterium]|nr:hypothetical protein [Candidatus Eremiobacteraeota bacterium]